MEKKYFTIGMAGHIDHGKTALTKALTNIDTDRLKEEKIRGISIELGFAPLYEDSEVHISVVDVPGHERFIRQMIAGVAGIDLVLLVVAADEGVMPQTKEHTEILQLLGIKQGMIVVTKVDKVEKDLLSLVKEDIREQLKGTVFEYAPIFCVDNVSKEGIESLKTSIIQELKKEPMRSMEGEFRLPIDQVFTVKGQGTVVRGTVYEGVVHDGDTLHVFPEMLEGKVRQIQVHHSKEAKGFAGQRVAINLANIMKNEIHRGDVLVSSPHVTSTQMLDVSLQVIADIRMPVKQRMLVKVYIGTAEVMGKITFFDRNKVESEHKEILCQLNLQQPIVAKRGDRFIIRRPSPPETIGGGWVIDPKGEKYRFGQRTMERLKKKKEATPEERLLELIKVHKGMAFQHMLKETSIPEEQLQKIFQSSPWIQYKQQHYTHERIITSLDGKIRDELQAFHTSEPMKQGMKKAELIHVLSNSYPKDLIHFVMERGEEQLVWKQKGPILQLTHFHPYIPDQWKKRAEEILHLLKQDGVNPDSLFAYFNQQKIPEKMREDLKQFFIYEKKIIMLDEKFAWHMDVFEKILKNLHVQTDDHFELKKAKEITQLSRKFLIPFLETCDRIGMTKREGNQRLWIE
ncbi:selenocysteine-specific elongation factor [Oikeobacillus pervagus]|uniref:Selenocysteine-specific elongation factor n=1 Tax=Oikeobacillus pervagus TaxID=1325931 RepID=A0AAJ1WIQ4_9BACI|nr:selenocysteine-specific translation elongation factor [Oikeobacillus pervagus]MDQ0214653.1 selenocysteine-specific elongation factor [Oikeobacillus pervagus]